MRILLISLACTFLVIGLLHFRPSRSDAYTQLQSIGFKRYSLGSSKMLLFIADTDQERTKGLSGIKKMADNEGVIFTFDRAGQKAFWMKDMNFSLDFVYLNSNRVVELKENVSPSSFPNTIVNEKPADAIIELNAGQIRKKSIEIGDVLEPDSN